MDWRQSKLTGFSIEFNWIQSIEFNWIQLKVFKICKFIGANWMFNRLNAHSIEVQRVGANWVPIGANWRQPIERLNGLAPINSINWRQYVQSDCHSIGTQLSANWRQRIEHSIERQLNSIEFNWIQSIEWYFAKNDIIEWYHSIGVNWCTIEFNECQLTSIGANWHSIE